jgi:hypothetical protein
MLLHEHLENGADKNPNFPFSEFEGNSLSYQEANLLSNQLANKLVSEGLEVGIDLHFLQKIVLKWQLCTTLHQKLVPFLFH